MTRRNASLHLKILLPIDPYHQQGRLKFGFQTAFHVFNITKSSLYQTKHYFQFSDGIVKVSVY